MRITRWNKITLIDDEMYKDVYIYIKKKLQISKQVLAKIMCKLPE